MKKNRYFLPIQMRIIMFMVSACSEKKSLRESTISEQQSGTFAEPAMPEPTEDEMDAAGTGDEQTKAAKTDGAKAWDMKPDDEGRLPLSPDLNQNGIAEEVHLVDIDGGQELQILENGELIHMETGYYAHAGQTSVFLCTLEGQDYLLRYRPTVFQGVGSYSYVLPAFADNKEKMVS